MTVTELRNKLVNYAIQYVGCKQGDTRHQRVIDTFNLISPLPDGWKMTYTAAWCAAFVSACAHACKFDSIFPLSANCGTMMTKAMKMGIWVEDDGYRPRPGDLIMYDWGDNGAGDDKGAPDHVGIVVNCEGGNIKVVEGNYSTKHICSYRNIPVNGRYIRGFIVPMYAKLAGAKIYASGRGQRTGTRVYSAPSFKKPLKEVIPSGQLVYCYGTHRAELFEWWKIDPDGGRWVRKTSLRERKTIK